jgi:hypothetical protein
MIAIVLAVCVLSIASRPVIVARIKLALKATEVPPTYELGLDFSHFGPFEKLISQIDP